MVQYWLSSPQRPFAELKGHHKLWPPGIINIIITTRPKLAYGRLAPRLRRSARKWSGKWWFFVTDRQTLHHNIIYITTIRDVLIYRCSQRLTSRLLHIWYMTYIILYMSYTMYDIFCIPCYTGWFFYWPALKMAKCQNPRKFWHLELFRWDLSCNLSHF